MAEKLVDVAVFIDFENIYYSVRNRYGESPDFAAIVEECRRHGRITAARAYADCARYEFRNIPSALYANGIEPVYVPVYYRDNGDDSRHLIKNSIDLYLSIDAMKTLYTQPSVQTFVILTGDRDFIPLTNSLRQSGKRVVVIGVEGAASTHLAQSVDEFLYYYELLEDEGEDIFPDDTLSDIVALPYSTLFQALDACTKQELGCPVEGVKRFVDEFLPALSRGECVNEKGEHIPGFEALLAEAEHRGWIRQTRDPEGNLFLAAVERPSRAVNQRRLETALQALRRALLRGAELGYDQFPVATVKPAMRRFVPDFDERKLKDPWGRPFLRFKDFLREAERRGLVSILTSGGVEQVVLVEDEVAETPDSRQKKARPSGQEPVFAVEPPAMGVEILSYRDYLGQRYYTLLDKRNNRVIRNVVRDQARGLWRYAIEQYERFQQGKVDITWNVDIGLVNADFRVGKERYDLAQRDLAGGVHIYYGVTGESLTGHWMQFRLLQSGQRQSFDLMQSVD